MITEKIFRFITIVATFINNFITRILQIFSVLFTIKLLTNFWKKCKLYVTHTGYLAIFVFMTL